jgi:hypothetical protein
MKKFVFASVMALASISLVSAPTLRAQDSDQITIKDPAEFNAYQMATTQSDPKAKAAGLETFLQTYPQSVVKSTVLDMLVDTYQQVAAQAKDAQTVADANDHTLSAASRLLQVDPNNTKAIYVSVDIKKRQCQRTGDAQTCDDAAAMANKGLATPKPAKTSETEWKKQTDATYPIFHSAKALDDATSRKDFKGAISEYRTELMLLPPEATKVVGPGLADTLQIAEAYAKQEAVDGKAAREAELRAKAAMDADAKAQAQKDAKDAKDQDANDMVQAVWFYGRAWDYAPAAFKSQIEPKIEYYYKRYHGNLDGLDEVKAKAADTVFPPGTFVISPAATPDQIAHKAMVETPDLSKMALTDAEYVLANGSKDDTDKLWAGMKDKATPVPGVVIEATASVIKVAVTQDAKDAKVPDFIVNMKTPLADKAIPAVGFAFGDHTKGEAELDGTYDTYTQVPATATAAQSAQIVLRDGAIIPKKVVPAHKPTPAHRPATH